MGLVTACSRRCKWDMQVSCRSHRQRQLQSRQRGICVSCQGPCYCCGLCFNTMASSPGHAEWQVEEAPRQKDSLRHAAYSAVVTLTLGVLGSTVLPVPYAFSKLGVFPGCCIMAVVAFANDRTCCMLVRASGITHRTTYEQLAQWAGGRRARVITQWSLILLLYGTLCGGLAFLSDVARMMMLKGVPSNPPATSADPNTPLTFRLSHSTHTSIDTSSSTAGLGMQSVARALLSEQQSSKGGLLESPAWWDSAWAAVAAWLGHVWDVLLPIMQADGRPLMLLVVATILYPLCLQPHIRQFEKAATVGVVVVVALMAIIVYKAVAAGFPAVAAGQLPVWRFHKGGGAALPEAFAVLGFAFYMQPMLMPLVAEMPPGGAGRKVSEWAVHVVLYGVACSAYGVVGVFGAATYGDDTQSNIMVNDLLAGQPHATLVLYGALLVYLCCGMVTTHYALRASMEVLLTGTSGQLSTRSRVLLTSGNLLAALAVACSFPTQAERIFAFTGCTAVCLVCYVLPVYIHLKLEHVCHEHGARAACHLHKERRRDLAALQNALQKQRSPGDDTTTAHTCGQCGTVMCTSCGGLLPASPGSSPPHTPTEASAQGMDIRTPLLAGAGDDGEAGGALQQHTAQDVQCSRCSWVATSPSVVKQQEEADVSALGALVEEPCNYPWSCTCSSMVKHRTCWQKVQLYSLPVLIVAVGVGCSIAGLYVGILDVWKSYHPQGQGR